MYGQTVQTHIRLSLEKKSNQGFTVYNSFSIFLWHYSIVKPFGSFVCMITTMFKEL